MDRSDERRLQNKVQKEANYWIVNVTVGWLYFYFIVCLSNYSNWMILFWVAPFNQLLKHQLLKHQLLKHQLLALKHQLSKTSTD